MIAFILIFLMTLMSASASVFLKRASGSDGIFLILKDINLYVGLALYGGSALLNIYVLKSMDYSIVLPLTSITYIWTMLLSFLLLRESISPKKLLGVIGIIAGAILVTL